MGLLTNLNSDKVKYNSGLEIAGNGLVNGDYRQASNLPKATTNITPFGVLSNLGNDLSNGIQEGAGKLGSFFNGAVKAGDKFLNNLLEGTGLGNFLGIGAGNTEVNDNSNLEAGDVNSNPQLDISGSSAGSNNELNGASLYNSAGQVATPSANDYYYSLYQQTGDPAFLEKYIDNQIERENVSSARAYEQYMSNTGFSRYVQDIENAGYNPWLALQSGSSSAASYGSSVAGTSQVSQSSQLTSRYNNKISNSTKVVTTGISTLGRIIQAFLNMVH